MVIRINHKKVIGKAIEWSDKARKQPICFIAKCPYCLEKQWIRKQELYTAHNNTKNNHRCYSCGVGAAPKRLFKGPDYIEVPFKGLKPRNPGWRSVYYNTEDIDE